MAYVNSIRPRLSFGSWIKAIFIHPNFIVNPDSYDYDYSDAQPRVEIESIFTGSFVKTYGFDGSVFHLEYLADPPDLLPWCILNFFGIPSRPGEEYRQIIRNFLSFEQSFKLFRWTW